MVRRQWVGLVAGSAALVLLGSGCGSSSGTTDGPSGPQDAGAQDDAGTQVTLSGAVQKGPFVLGSSVAVSAIDSAGNPTGDVFNTQTTDDLGQFSLQIDYLGLVSLEGDGFYYNEVTGELSTAPITLRAFHELVTAGSQDAYINMVTHLSYGRVKSLLAGGEALADASTQAEEELRSALKIGLDAGSLGASGIEMNILGGDTTGNAYLFAVSAVVAQAAIDQGGPVDAALQELINTLSVDLADDGQISADLTTKLVAAQMHLDSDAVIANLAARLAALGSTATVPDLNQMIDTDQDGVMNDIDNCRTVVNPGQEDGDDDDTGDACECIPLDCPAPATGISVCGRVYDLATSLPIDDGDPATGEPSLGVKVSLYDPMALVGAPTTTPPLATVTPDDCGRYAAIDVAGASTLFVAVVVVVDDATAPTNQYVPTGVGVPTGFDHETPVPAFALTRATDVTWASAAGYPFGGTTTFGEVGSVVQVYTDAAQPPQGPFTGAPVAGVTVNRDGATYPADDYYFSDSSSLLRTTIDVGLAVTGANGTGILSGEKTDLSLCAGTGAEPATCLWPSMPCSVPGGFILVNEVVADCDS